MLLSQFVFTPHHRVPLQLVVNYRDGFNLTVEDWFRPVRPAHLHAFSTSLELG